MPVIIVSELFQLSLILEKGVGISLINSVPEELIFATLTGIRVCGSFIIRMAEIVLASNY